MNNYCSYYQATLSRRETLGVVSILKSFDHICFDRTLDAAAGLFEFFVPESQEPFFLKLMAHFQKEGTVTGLQKLPNRLEQGESIV
ncbi:MAG: hypothetical protein ACD_64C00018G0002 [uncultured bacterium]|nr:MAG: hypothetical protein ACD_64C00018G0002 [uncultured bacterium]HLE76728.1 hypothetical protein [Candidatus Babeliales bacterium]